MSQGAGNDDELESTQKRGRRNEDTEVVLTVYTNGAETMAIERRFKNNLHHVQHRTGTEVNGCRNIMDMANSGCVCSLPGSDAIDSNMYIYDPNEKCIKEARQSNKTNKTSKARNQSQLDILIHHLNQTNQTALRDKVLFD